MNVELLNAWRSCDAWAHRYAQKYRDAIAQNRMPYIGPEEGKREAHAMEDACAKAAADLGITTTDLRERLIDARRRGLCHEDAVTEVCG